MTDKKEIAACAARIEWSDGAHLWLTGETSRAVLHTTYVGDEPQSGEWDGGIPVTTFPQGKPRYQLQLPNLLMQDSIAEHVFSVQLWELRGNVMWHWVMPEWRPNLPEGPGTNGNLTASQAWRCGRVDTIAPAPAAT